MPSVRGEGDETIPGVDETLVATSTRRRSTEVRPVSGREPAELPRGTIVGRYVVLGRLGAGGMGVVHSAYDPELDRKIALKLLRPDSGDTTKGNKRRTRLLREAQALAKLAHPNIVAVHDVGEHEGSVWLAMEHVDGVTLAQWAKQERRSWREVVRVMSEAGRGLAAAHGAGLLHRDIKPDNIMIGGDARVRVMDFGLARTRSGSAVQEISRDTKTATGSDSGALAIRVTRVGAVLGTPAYMSPEQLAGRESTAASDQFSFCVTLWEMLFGERPFRGDSLVELAVSVLDGNVRRTAGGTKIPTWLRRACLRGMSADAEKRFGSMEALLETLERGQTRARARRWLTVAGSLALLGIGAPVYQRYVVAQRTAKCEAEGNAIAESWNEQVRIRVSESLLATGVSDASLTADKMLPYLDAQAQAWQATRTEACLDARVRDVWDESVLERSVWCLDERRMEFEALVTQFEEADATAVREAVAAAADLSQVDPCRNAVWLQQILLPSQASEQVRAVRRELSRAGALQSAGKYEESLQVASGALDSAEAVGWPPLRAEARFAVGTSLERVGRYAEAETALEHAYFEGSKAGALEVAARAATRLVATVGYQQARHAEGLRWARHGEVALAVLGDGEESLRRASLLDAVATVYRAMEANAEAKEHYERALHILETALGPEHPRVAVELGGLASVHQAAGRHEEAEKIYERALAILETALGPGHPDLATYLGNLAVVYRVVGRHEEAKRLQERALHLVESAFGPDHPEVAISLNNLAKVHEATGDYEPAREHYERALSIWEDSIGPEHPNMAASLNNLASVLRATGEYEAAREHYERALSIWEKALGHDHARIAYPLLGLADIALEQGQPDDAVSHAERVVALGDNGNVASELVSDAQFALARALWDRQDRPHADRVADRKRAQTLAAEAAGHYRHAKRGQARLTEIETWLERHGGEP